MANIIVPSKYNNIICVPGVYANNNNNNNNSRHVTQVGIFFLPPSIIILSKITSSTRQNPIIRVTLGRRRENGRNTHTDFYNGENHTAR